MHHLSSVEFFMSLCAPSSDALHVHAAEPIPCPRAPPGANLAASPLRRRRGTDPDAEALEATLDAHAARLAQDALVRYASAVNRNCCCCMQAIQLTIQWCRPLTLLVQLHRTAQIDQHLTARLADARDTPVIQHHAAVPEASHHVALHHAGTSHVCQSAAGCRLGHGACRGACGQQRGS